MKLWLTVLLIVGLSTALTISRLQIKNLEDEAVIVKFKTDAELVAQKNIVIDKQLTINIQHDSIKNSKEEAVRRIDSICKARDWKEKNLESDLSIYKHWVDSAKTAAVLSKPVPVNSKDTTTVFKEIPSSYPLLSIAASDQEFCWGMKGEIITRDPKAKFNVLQRTTSDWIDLFVEREKHFLGITWLWITHQPSYQIVNQCGPTVIRNIKIQ